ncbi:MAG: hypothetical protein J6M18_04700, partial [Actinomycetaceae bacterium]|nr:hypothetical protein [Actinomycetaceae bacterium]
MKKLHFFFTMFLAFLCSVSFFLSANLLANTRTASADTLPSGIIKEGNTNNFVQSGNIATVSIDTSKFKNGIFQADGNFAEVTDPIAHQIKVAYTGNVDVNSKNVAPGSFSYTFVNAATLQNGSYADVKMTYSNLIIYTA